MSAVPWPAAGGRSSPLGVGHPGRSAAPLLASCTRERRRRRQPSDDHDGAAHHDDACRPRSGRSPGLPASTERPDGSTAPALAVKIVELRGRPAPGRPRPGRHRLRGAGRGHHPPRRPSSTRPPSAPVGPIRSARDTDIELLGWPTAVRSSSGAAPTTGVAAAGGRRRRRQLQRRPRRRRGPSSGTTSGDAPDNLFIDSTDAFWAKPGDASPASRRPIPVPLSPPDEDAARRRARRSPGGRQSTTAGPQADFVWDAEPARAGCASRTAPPHVVAGGAVLAPTNVVLIDHAVRAQRRPDPRSPIALTDGDGRRHRPHRRQRRRRHAGADRRRPTRTR